MSSLTGRRPKDTYPWLLQAGAGGALTGSPRAICLGDGSATPLSLTDTSLQVAGGTALTTAAQSLTAAEQAQARTNLSAQTRAQPMVIVFLGDSITDGLSFGLSRYQAASFAGWTASRLDHAFLPARNNYPIPGPSVPCLDFGFSGYQTEDLIYRSVNELSTGGTLYPGVTLTPLQAALATSPGAIISLIGTNHIPTLTTPEVLTKLDTYLATVAATGVRHFIGEILPRTDTAADPTGTYQTKIDAVNAGLPALAAAHNATVIPWASALKTAGVAGSAYYNDEDAGAGTIYLHPNQGGHAAMAAVLAPFLAPEVGPAYPIPAKGSAGWLTTNPYMDVDTTPANNLADGFTHTGHTTAQLVTIDGITWQEYTAASYVYHFAPAISGGAFAALIANAVPLRVACQFWLVSGTCTCLALTCNMMNAGGTVLATAGQSYDISSFGIIPNHRGLLLSPVLVAPATTTQNSLTLLARFSAGAVIRIRQFGVFKSPL
jgi:lysophospholipase L1-like esterase